VDALIRSNRVSAIRTRWQCVTRDQRQIRVARVDD
jgi:hypothetical protein